MFDFIGTLSESKLISSTSNLEKYDDVELSELVVLYLCSLYMLYNDDHSKSFALSYAKRTIQYGTDFDKWRTSGTDLYVILHGIPDILDATLLVRWLREMSNDHVREQTHRALFSRIDHNFKIKNSAIRSVRRLVMDWDTLSQQDKRSAMTRLLSLLKARAQKSEVLDELEKMASNNKLNTAEIKNNLLLALSGSDHKKSVKENATSGATGAASIATAVGGLGANPAPGALGVGFAGSSGNYGIYQNQKGNERKRKALLIKR